jgi:predicted house-cleaning noncanonical NTP pyrophosphatase (MazG superfamily)
MGYIYYHGAWIEFMNELWLEGPTGNAPPKMPEESLRTLVNSRKRKVTASHNQDNNSKCKPKSFNKMTDEEFHEYLKAKLLENVEFNETATSYSTDLKVIAEDLNKLYGIAGKSDNVSLVNHVKLGGIPKPRKGSI